MYPKLLQIYGPLAIHSYGLMIVLGITVFSWLTLRHPRRQSLFSSEQFFSLVTWSIVAGLVGGHLLFVLVEEPTLQALIMPYGFSVLGSIAGVLGFLFFYLRRLQIPTLPFFDLIAIYAPILQGFGRIGCFLAGCCYGRPSTLPWAIIYTNPNVEAPVCTPLHPSQLYSAAFLFIIAALMHFYAQHIFKKQGQLICLYIMLVSLERFLTDFFRDDHGESFLSSYQYLALAAMAVSLLFFFIIQTSKPRRVK